MCTATVRWHLRALGWLVFSTTLLPRFSFSQTTPKPAEPYAEFPRIAELEKKTTAELIDLLEKIKEPTHCVWANFGDDKEPVYPPFAELTRRGAAAVPELLKHLEDKRTTSLEKIDKHQITVGDLCYVALGQILNEPYYVYKVAGQFGGELHSPTDRPSLAKAIREQWGKLGPSDPEKLLVKAVLRTDPYVDYGALFRLTIYYPKTAEDVAVRLLTRQLYDEEKHCSFVFDLGEEPDESKWNGMIEAYVRENGEAVRPLIPFWIQWYYFETSIGWKPGQKERAAKIMAKFYPKFERHAPVHLAVEGIDEQTNVVRALSFFKSARVDAAIHTLFMKAKDFKFATRKGFTDDNFHFQEFAIAGFERLKETKYGDDFRAYFLAKAATLESQTPKDWRDIDRWHKLATGKRKSVPPTAEQLQAAAELKALGIRVDGWAETIDYADQVMFIPGDDDEKKPFPVAAFPHIAKLTRLRELWLEGPGVTDAGMAHLNKFSQLEEVRLAKTKITSTALSYLTSSKELRVLDVSGTEVDDVGLAHVAKFERLEKLTLAGTRVTGKGLSHLRGLKNLKNLDLAGCRNVKDGDLANLAGLREPTDLTLDAPEVGDDDLKQLYGLTKLKRLTFRRCRATPQGIASLQKKLPKAEITYYLEFQLKETPQGVLLTMPQVTVLLEAATLPTQSDSEDTTKVVDGDEPDIRLTKDSISGSLGLSGRGTSFMLMSNSMYAQIGCREDGTQIYLECPQRGNSKVHLKFNLLLTNSGGTLRCGEATFDLQTLKRITVDTSGKAREVSK